MKLFSLKRLVLSLTLLSSLAHAQDYPYDDAPTEKKDDTKLPVEKATTAPTTDPATSKKRYHSLFRAGLKMGANYSIFQNPDSSSPAVTNQFSGTGFEGVLAFGWDLPYQPIFVEVETGYRGILMTSGNEPLHIIPTTLGFHYRDRLGRSSLWKPGIKSSFELRFTKNTTTGANIFSMNPTITLSSLLEFGNLLFEPMVTLVRIQEQYNFIIFAFRAGYRF